MDTTTINAIISFCGVIIVCVINNIVVIKKMQDDSRNELKTQISMIEKKTQSQISDLKDELIGNTTNMTAQLEEIIANQEVSQATIKKDLEYHLHCLQELDKKVEKHNQVIERTYELERRADVTDAKILGIADKLNDIRDSVEKR